jgi:hypothetical protein
MYFKDWWEDVECICLGQNLYQWWAVVITVISLWGVYSVAEHLLPFPEGFCLLEVVTDFQICTRCHGTSYNKI